MTVALSQYARAQRGEAQQRQKPPRLGLAFAHLGAAQKLHRPGEVDLPDGIDPDQDKGQADEHGRIAHGAGREGEREGNRLSHQPGEEHVHQLVQKHARGQAQDQADEEHQRRLPQEQAGQVAFSMPRMLYRPNSFLRRRMRKLLV